VIHAIDDPLSAATGTRAKILSNPHITLLETAHGATVHFLPSPMIRWRWAERQIMRFFSTTDELMQADFSVDLAATTCLEFPGVHRSNVRYYDEKSS